MEPLLLYRPRAHRGRHRALRCVLRAPLSFVAPLAGIRSLLVVAYVSASYVTVLTLLHFLMV
jgi:hypothetical protein